MARANENFGTGIIADAITNPEVNDHPNGFVGKASQINCDPAFVNQNDNADLDNAIERLRNAVNNGTAALPSDVIALLSHFILGQSSTPSLKSNIVANSAFSITDFTTLASSLTNNVSGSTVSFAYGQAEQRPPLNTNLRQKFIATGGETDNRRNIWIGFQKMNAIRAGISNRSRIIGVGTSSNGEHTLVNLRSNAAGTGGFFNYTMYNPGSQSYDFDLDYIFTDDSVHGIDGGSREHFFTNNIMAWIFKTEEEGTDNYQMAMSAVRLDENMNYIETQHYGTTPPNDAQGRKPEPSGRLDFSKKIFQGGDADGSSDHEFLAAEGCQYTTTSEVSNELHPGSASVNQGLRHLPSSNRALLGEYTTTPSTFINTNIPLKSQGEDVLTGSKIGVRTQIGEENVNVLISQRLTASGITINTDNYNDNDIIEFWSGKNTTVGSNKKVWFKIGEVTVAMWNDAPTVAANTTADFRGNNMNIVTGDHVASVREMVARTSAGEVLYTTQSSDNVEQDANPLRVYHVVGA